MKKILVIEDDQAIRTGIVDALQFSKYETLEAADGIEGQALAIQVDCNLVLLDLVMPGQDGFKVLESVRKIKPSLPVILLTAMGAENDKVKGLKLGADDYVVKPFSIKELLARVEAVLRRSAERPEYLEVIELKFGSADFERMEIRFQDGAKSVLSTKEVQLLRYLTANSQRPVSRDEILSRVWCIDPDHIATRTIDMHIARLREKIRDDAKEPQQIVTVRGKGYMFVKETGA